MIGDFQKLMAETYDKSNFLEENELEFWAECCKKANGPIVELGSGTGRLLIPLLEMGFDISAFDNSKEMMDICKKKIADKGLKLPNAYMMSMPDFKLDSNFSLIILADGSLSLFTKDKDILTLFSRVYENLIEGGSFVFDAILHSKDDKDDFPDANEWKGDYLWIDKNTIITRRKFTKYNKSNHCWETPIIYEKYRNGKLVDSEMNVRYGRLFSVNEILDLLSKSEFKKFKATDWLTDKPFEYTHKMATFKCIKK